MTKFLVRKFVPDFDHPEKETVRGAVGSLSGGVGIGVNLLLFLGKLLAGLLSGSVSIMADALNNLSDASGSILTLVGFRLAAMPADEDHPYGHARSEYLSALAVSVMIMIIGFELGKSSVEKILDPTPVQLSLVTVAILVMSIAGKLWLSRFNSTLGNHIRSNALLASAADSRNDCVATGAVLIAGLVEQLLNLRVDGIMGLGVAVFILRSGWGLARETISPLLGERVDPELRQKIVDYVQSQPKVLGYHDLMVHDYGPGRQFASLHVEMDYREDPLVCHELIDEMERRCIRNYGVHLVIHYDPVVTDDPVLMALKERVTKIMKGIDSRLTLHDFRMVPGKRHMNLVFDVVLPMDLQGQEKKIQQTIQEAMNSSEELTYHIVITFDLNAA